MRSPRSRSEPDLGKGLLARGVDRPLRHPAVAQLVDAPRRLVHGDPAPASDRPEIHLHEHPVARVDRLAHGRRDALPDLRLLLEELRQPLGAAIDGSFDESAAGVCGPELTVRRPDLAGRLEVPTAERIDQAADDLHIRARHATEYVCARYSPGGWRTTKPDVGR